MTKLKCLRCGWQWTPRTDNPAMCPYCKTRLWNVAAVEEKTEQEKQADA